MRGALAGQERGHGVIDFTSESFQPTPWPLYSELRKSNPAHRFFETLARHLDPVELAAGDVPPIKGHVLRPDSFWLKLRSRDQTGSVPATSRQNRDSSER